MTNRRETYWTDHKPHGLYNFCMCVIVGVVICVGVVLLAAVNG